MEQHIIDCEHPHILQMAEQLRTDSIYRNKVRSCPVCKQGISDRRVTLFSSLIGSLYQVYRWCGENQCHEFTTKQIRHLLGRNEYCRFGDLVRFGGIVYKPTIDGKKAGKARFGINMARAKDFFTGHYKIPLQILLNAITGEIIESNYVTASDFPKLKDLLKADGLYNDQMDLIK